MRFLKKFDTLNYSNVFLFEKYCISSKESKNKARLKYLSKYLCAINNELNFGDFEKKRGGGFYMAIMASRV